MRTLHVISTLNPTSGGPAEFVLTLLANTPPGDHAEAVTLDDPAAPYLANLPVTALGPVGSVYAYSPRLIPWLRQNRSRFDVAIIHGLWQFTGLSTALAYHQTLPYLVFPHGMLDPHFKHAYPAKHLKKWPYWLLAEYWILRNADRVLFTTTEESRLALQSFPIHRWNAQVIPFGTLAPTGSPSAQVESFLAHNPTLRNQRFLLFLGRIHRKKGCDLLLEAFIRIATVDPDLHLVIAGPDQQSWATELKALASSAGLSHRIHWPGMLTGDAKWGAFHAAEAFVLPSHQENFGIAVAEALACGKPVLLSDKVNIAPEIATDQAGFVEPDTLEGTETLLRRWLQTTPTNREAMQQNALTCFHTHYDLSQNLPEIYRLLSPRSGPVPHGVPPARR